LPVQSRNHVVYRLLLTESASVVQCEQSAPELEQPDSVWNPERQQRRSIQEPVDVLIVRVVVLVPPDFLGFFFENQQDCRFSQSLFLESEILFQFPDTLAF